MTYTRLADSPRLGAPCALDAATVAALLRLGPETFLSWACRGHLSVSQ